MTYDTYWNAQRFYSRAIVSWRLLYIGHTVHGKHVGRPGHVRSYSVGKSGNGGEHSVATGQSLEVYDFWSPEPIREHVRIGSSERASDSLGQKESGSGRERPSNAETGQI